VRSPTIFDTSVVFNFGHRSGGYGENILRQLGAEHKLVIPPDVQTEMLQDVQDDFDYPAFLQTHFTVYPTSSPSPDDERLQDLSKKLGADELAVISLSLHCSGTAAIDEKKARGEAKKLDILVVGTIGLLNEAVTQKWVDGNSALEMTRTIVQLGGRLPDLGASKRWSEYWESIPH
jgi:predicted nucleic acid-binding protein